MLNKGHLNFTASQNAELNGRQGRILGAVCGGGSPRDKGAEPQWRSRAIPMEALEL